MRWTLAALMAVAPLPAAAQAAPELTNVSQVEEASVADLQSLFASGETSVAVTRAYLARIAAMNGNGVALRAVIAVNPNALDEARASDARRKAGKTLGPLDGVPVLIKDNIETRDQPTTAGSLALAANDTKRDAPMVARLRAAGMVILGKTNLSEWANIRSTGSMSGWSAVGGLVRNPYALDRTACGSSSGTGAAIAASFAAVGVGTETDGSVVCPSSMNGLVGLKPSIGLVSRTHVVPISHSQDTPGPMGRSVRDVAALFTAMVGSDPADAVTKDADAYLRANDVMAGLKADALKGVRIGVIRPGSMNAALAERFDAALAVMKAQGAVLVDVTPPKLDGLGEAEFTVLKVELKADLNAYLATTPPSVKTRTLADVIAFNTANAGAEMPYFAQEIFEMAEATRGLDDPDYKAARAKSLRLAGAEGLGAMMRKNDVSFLVEPTYGAAWPSDPVYGDQYNGPSSSELPAVAGWPNLTVPMGLVQGLPVGISFMGPALSDARLLALGYAYEQASKARQAPRYLPSVDSDLGPRSVPARP